MKYSCWMIGQSDYRLKLEYFQMEWMMNWLHLQGSHWVRKPEKSKEFRFVFSRPGKGKEFQGWVRKGMEIQAFSQSLDLSNNIFSSCSKNVFFGNLFFTIFCKWSRSENWLLFRSGKGKDFKLLCLTANENVCPHEKGVWKLGNLVGKR